jgi:hypothetical protein
MKARGPIRAAFRATALGIALKDGIMLLYRFKIDETVIANADGVSPGPYRITRLLTVSEDD